MIPLRDTIRSKNFPAINTLIIGLNALVFLWQLSLGRQTEEVFYLLGIVPARYSDPAVAAHFTTFQQFLPFVTSMFLHGGFVHILGNMWFLFIFGDHVEDTLGHMRYLLFYVLCGVAAGVIHLLTNWGSELPTIGASGAIAGVMGGYLVLFPRSRVLTLVPIFFFFQIFEIPAFLFVGYWLLIQVFSASLTPRELGGVAWWAHLGGFVCGVIFVKLLGVIPRTGLTDALHRYTERKRIPRVHNVSPVRSLEELDAEGVISISPKEARMGTRKLISVPQDHRKRTVIVTIPPGTEEGARLRLRGLGQSDDEGNRGDLYLRIRVKTD